MFFRLASSACTLRWCWRDPLGDSWPCHRPVLGGRGGDPLQAACLATRAEADLV